jgi:hypothetical protein
MSYGVDLSNHDPAAARALVEQVVEDWRGVIEQDTLKIPSQSGLRRGVVAARLGIERLGAHGSRVTLEPTEEWLEVHLASVVILLIGAIGGIGMVFWPFFPRLTPVMPVAFLTTLGAWFLVASRLGQVGLAELADAIRRAASAPSE